jgi:hypothetical protein
MFQVIDEYTENRIITCGLIVLFVFLSNVCLFCLVMLAIQEVMKIKI